MATPMTPMSGDYECEGVMADRWLGWHFLPADRRLRGSREVVEAGRTYRAEGPLEICENGMHASARAIDALMYAPGPLVCRVELVGERLDAADKSCARERSVLWLADATTVLHEFACTVATDALHLAEARGARVDPRSWAAIETKRRWLRGEATDADLTAAWDAARAAAWAAAGDAAWADAWAAARADAWAAAEAAARDAARDAAWNAARAAARAAAWAAAWADAWAAAGAAARAAAGAAARAAAGAAARDAAGAAAWTAARDAAGAAAGADAGDAAGADAWDAARAAQTVVLEAALRALE